MKSKSDSRLLNVATVLWVAWCVNYIFTGIVTMAQALRGDTDLGFFSLAGVNSRPDRPGNAGDFFLEYPDGVTAVLGQHGFNMFWAGVVTLICVIYIWRGNKNAIFFAATISGLTELGHFFFLTLHGHDSLFFGIRNIIIVAVAIILSFYAYFTSKRT